MTNILREIGIQAAAGGRGSTTTQTKPIGGDAMACWRLLPMISPNLESADLGDILQHALERIVDAPWNNNHNNNNQATHEEERIIMEDGSHHYYSDPEEFGRKSFEHYSGEREKLGSTSGVVFLGMDSPELKLLEIVKGLRLATTTTSVEPSDDAHQRPSAFLCPSDDGGYGMLCVPSSSVKRGIFQNVLWSHPLTAVSQLKALTDACIPVVLGHLMHDIDETEDVHKLCERLSSKGGKKEKDGTKTVGLELCSTYYHHRSTRIDGKDDGSSTAMTPSIKSRHPECKYTEQALQKLGQL